MAFIGNTNTTQAFTPAIDYFSGNGSTTAFTLSRPVASVAQVQVTIDNVAQNPSSAYTVSANTITFTSAPLSGTNNIYVYYTSPITQVIAPGQGTVTTASLNTGSLAIPVANVTGVTPAVVSDQANTSTGAFDLPSGTTAQRPASPLTGSQRWNTDLVAMEYYNGTAWSTTFIAPYSIDYLIVAGGGGGGYDRAAGGGAGGYISSTGSVTPVTGYAITIGSGGAGGTTYGNRASGSNSSAFSNTAVGGGYGQDGGANNGASGGSGGGAGSGGGSGGAGTSGQGNTGGSAGGGTNGGGSGGGGGASAVGSNGGTSNGVGGNGGAGSNWQSLGTFYAGGGGGGAAMDFPAPRSGGSGGTGGGGGGGNTNGAAGTAGTTNTGGGGGGGANIPQGNGGNGGSGIVIVRYSGSQRGTGGTVTSSGGYTYHTFTSSGTYTA